MTMGEMGLFFDTGSWQKAAVNRQERYSRNNLRKSERSGDPSGGSDADNDEKNEA